jgi:hypothetical protein
MKVRWKQSYNVKIQSQACSGFRSIFAPAAFTVAGLTNTLDARALEKLHGKIYRLNHDARIGESLAEYKQAMAMIGKPLNGIRQLIGIHERRAIEAIRNVERRVGKPLSRFDARDLKEANRAIASLYLEWTFGMKPLLLDIVEVTKAIQQSRNSCATVLNASFTGDAIYSDDTVNDDTGALKFNLRSLKKVKTTVRYKVGIDPVKVDVGPLVERLGVTPREFIPTMYAVLPYSWLLDYFTGINATVEALCSDLSFTTWTCKTVRSVCTREDTANPDHARASKAFGSVFVDSIGSPAVFTATLITTARSVPSSLIPAPVLRMPQTIKPWLNIAMLLVQKRVANGGFLAGQFSTAGLPSKTGYTPLFQ